MKAINTTRITAIDETDDEEIRTTTECLFIQNYQGQTY
jgi:hypothetical protein